MASSSSGTGQPAKEDSEALSVSGDDASRGEEKLEEGDLTTCSAPKSKQVGRAVIHTISSGTELDAAMWSMLDDHLLEKIFARLPLKSLFQVPPLSKTWRARFRSHSFQSEWAMNWTHSYVPKTVVNNWSLIAGAGSLLCWASVHGKESDIHVTNPLTGSWKQLPPRPKMHHPKFVQVDWERGSKAYKVIAGTMTTRKSRDDRSGIRVQIFDSRDDSWVMESYKTVANISRAWFGSAFRNGVLYMLLYTVDAEIEANHMYALISFDVKETIWNEIPALYLVSTQDQDLHQLLPFSFSDIQCSRVFSCRSNVLLVVNRFDMDLWRDLVTMDLGYEGCGESPENIIYLYRLDLHRGLAFEVAKAADSDEIMPNAAGASLSSAADQDDCIYIGEEHDCSGILYNVGTQQWHRWNPSDDRSEGSRVCFGDTPMTLCQRTLVVYQPGLNPFQEV